MNREQVSRTMRERGFNHTAGNQWGKLTGKRVIYAYAVLGGDGNYSISWPVERESV